MTSIVMDENPGVTMTKIEGDPENVMEMSETIQLPG